MKTYTARKSTGGQCPTGPLVKKHTARKSTGGQCPTGPLVGTDASPQNRKRPLAAIDPTSDEVQLVESDPSSRTLAAAIAKENKRHEEAIAAILREHKHQVAESSEKVCAVCKLNNSTDEDEDDGEDCAWADCEGCGDVFCLGCVDGNVEECEECESRFCSGCIEKARGCDELVMLPTGRTLGICEDCEAGGGFKCCNTSVTRVPCGVIACSQCEELNHRL